MGLFRRAKDREQANQQSGVQPRMQSARALRNSRDYDVFADYDEESTVFVKPIHGLAAKRPQSQSSLTSTAAFGLLLVVGVFVATLGMPEGGAPQTQRGESKASGNSFRSTIRSYATVKLQDDFKSGLSSWAPSGSSGRDWTIKDGFARPAKLRLWKRSLKLSDYNLEFVSEIEQKGIGWAYRAKDSQNYYANKIVITRPGPLPTADLVRYAIVNGVQRNHTSVPLNMTLRRDTLYRVQMTVKGADFSTAVNGQMVDTWSDASLRAGGVGFFAENGELASLRYVQLTDKDTVIGRFLSYLGFLRPLTPGVF